MTQNRVLLCKVAYKHLTWYSNADLHFEEQRRTGQVKVAACVIAVLVFFFFDGEPALRWSWVKVAWLVSVSKLSCITDGQCILVLAEEHGQQSSQLLRQQQGIQLSHLQKPFSFYFILSVFLRLGALQLCAFHIGSILVLWPSEAHSCPYHKGEAAKDAKELTLQSTLLPAGPTAWMPPGLFLSYLKLVKLSLFG